MTIKSFQEFKENFNIKAEQVQDKLALVKNEVKEIENFIVDAQYVEPFPRRTRGIFSGGVKSKSTAVFELDIHRNYKTRFVDFFNDYNLHNKVNLDRDSYQLESTYQDFLTLSNQAKEFVEYYKWLLNQQNEKVTPKAKKSELTHKQKMLALHYLGLDLSKYDNTKSAKILSMVLDLDEGNTRKYLSYLSAGKNDVRTKSNLSKLNEVFKHLGLDDIAFTIKSDLDKMK